MAAGDAANGMLTPAALKRECERVCESYFRAAQDLFTCIMGDDRATLEGILGQTRPTKETQGLMLLTACVHGAAQCASYLVGMGALPSLDLTRSPLFRWFTPLTLAAHLGHWEVAKALMEGGGEAHAVDSRGWSGLWHAAVEYPRGALDDMLGYEGTRQHLNTAGTNGMTVLMVASASAVPVLVEAGASVDLATEYMGTALWFACKYSSLQKVKALVEAGGDLRFVSGIGVTPLMVAAIDGRTEIVRYLLTQPAACINAMTNDGMTALEGAAGGGHLEVVKLLVGAGARVDPMGDGSMGALFYAIQSSQLEVISCLVREGRANMNHVLPSGATPCDLAARQGYWDVVRCLVELGADLSLCSPGLLIEAVLNGDIVLVSLLLERGIDVQARGEGEATALHLAAMSAGLFLVKRLVKAGADVEARDYDGLTPAHYAANHESLQNLKWLVEGGGADAWAKDSHGLTPRDYAAANRNHRMVTYLDSIVALQRAEEDGRVAEKAGAARTSMAHQDEDRKAAGAKKRTDQSDREDAEGAPSRESTQQQDHQQQGSTTDAQAQVTSLASLEIGEPSICAEQQESKEGRCKAGVGVGQEGGRLKETEGQGPQERRGSSVGGRSESSTTAVEVAAQEMQSPAEEEMLKVPLEGLSCPISFQLMTDPVMADDGHTYHRPSIEAWIKKCREGGRPLTSPLTGSEMGSSLRPNLFVKSLVRNIATKGM